jgi:hypothetical protein
MQCVLFATGTSCWERTQASAIPKMQGKPFRKFTFLSCCVSEDINDSRRVKIKKLIALGRQGLENYRFLCFQY